MVDSSRTAAGGLDTRLRLHPAIEVIQIPGQRLQFYGAEPTFTVEDVDGHMHALLAWCDGTRTERELLHLLSARIPEPDRLLEYLKARGCLVPLRPAPNDAFLEYLDLASLAQPYARPTRERSDMQLVLSGTGALAVETRSALALLGWNVRAASSDDAGPCDLVIATSDGVDHALFREWNREALAAKRPILFCHLDRHVVRIGPLVVPDESACFECFHHRARSNVMFRDEFDARVSNVASPDSRAVHSALAARLAATLAATAASGWLLGAARLGRPNQLTELDLLTNRTQQHAILKLPRCPECGLGVEHLQRAAYQPYAAVAGV